MIPTDWSDKKTEHENQTVDPWPCNETPYKIVGYGIFDWVWLHNYYDGAISFFCQFLKFFKFIFGEKTKRRYFLLWVYPLCSSIFSFSHYHNSYDVHFLTRSTTRPGQITVTLDANDLLRLDAVTDTPQY